MATSFAMDDDEDVNINDPIYLEDLSDQETTDLLEPARKVIFEIKKAEIRKQHEDSQDKKSPITVTRLNLQAKVAGTGTDGEGKYAGRVLFPEFVLAFSHDLWESKGGPKGGSRNSEWWEKTARGPAKSLFLALGFDLKEMPAIDADFLSGLQGREFMADIKQSKVQEKTDEINAKGKNVYKDTGEYKNELASIRAIG